MGDDAHIHGPYTGTKTCPSCKGAGVGKTHIKKRALMAWLTRMTKMAEVAIDKAADPECRTQFEQRLVGIKLLIGALKEDISNETKSNNH